LLGHPESRVCSARVRDRLRADNIGFLFQQFNLLPWLSAIDNVLLPCTFSATRDASGRAARSRHAPSRRTPADASRPRAFASWQKRAAELSASASSSASPRHAR
jgi:putative ABC transport system ATP-binding protein